MKNKYKHNPDGTTTIFLGGKKYGTKEALVDTEDWEKVKGYRWRFIPGGTICGYAVSTVPHPDGGMYISPQGKRRHKRQIQLRLHHVVLGKPTKGLVTDHIDGNGLNNCKSNLRHVTERQNAHNKPMKSSNTSGFIGVILRKGKERGKKWTVRIHVQGKLLYLGDYYTKEEAAEAYDKGVVKHREIINPERQLNFPHKLQEYLKENQVETGGA